MKFSESKQAYLLLERRKHKSSYAYLCRLTFKRSLLSVLLCSALILIGAYLRIPACWIVFVVGMVVGSLLRDWGWFRAMKKSWPFVEKVMDWEKVEKLASERVAGEEPVR